MPAREPAVELPSDARIQATGKRKTSIARVILRAGSGSFEINKRSLEEYFPRHQHQTLVRQPLLTSGYEGKVDVRVRVHGGGISGQAGAVRHGIARALTEIDARASRGAEAPRAADQGRPGQGAAQGRAQEGPQAPAVLEEVVATKLFGTDGVRGVAGTELTAELALALGRAAALESASRAAPGPDRPRHARVRPDAGGGARGREWPRAVATPGSPACCRRRPRRSSSAGTASTWPRSSPRPTTPGGTTGSSSSAPDGRKLEDEAEAGIEARVAQARLGAAASRRAGPRARRRARRLPARAALGLPPGPLRAPRAARLRQRGDLPGCAVRLRAAGGGGRDDRRGAGRAQHQRGLRLHPPGASGRARSAAAAPRSASPSTATATG